MFDFVPGGGIRSSFVADALRKDVLDSAVKPSSVARQKFDVERRGFDQAQVRAYLIAVADALRDAQDREAEIRSRLGKAIRRAEKAEAAVRDRHATDDPGELTRQLGDEVAGVLDAARVAGEQKLAAAEKSADQLLTNAKAEATEIRTAADSIMEVRRAEADAVAAELMADRQVEADKLVETARRDAELLRNDAAADVARVRDECDNLIREAEEARGQILQDMDRRRRQARAQVERLRVGRDRLLRSYDVVRRTLDESTVELKSSLREAKVLGDTAARTAASEPLSTPEQLEAELADARLVGRDHRVQPPARGAERESASPDVQVPHVDMRPGAFSDEAAPTPKRPVVRQQPVPKPPATAPQIKTPEPVAAVALAEPADEAQADAEFAGLKTEELTPVDPSDEIETVVALVPDTEETVEGQVITWVPADTETVPTSNEDAAEAEDPTAAEAPSASVDEVIDVRLEATGSSSGLFAALRAQAGDGEEETVVDAAAAREMAKQRDAVIAEIAKDVEKRLKRALADEQNEVLAGIRAASKGRRAKKLELISLVGETDEHVGRYVGALHDTAARAYAAGAALVDREPRTGEMPAGAVEEMLGSAVVLPLRLRLIELDAVEAERATVHVDALRAFYRQRKTDHLGEAATSLAGLLVTAGACDCLPDDVPVPWLVGADRH